MSRPENSSAPIPLFPPDEANLSAESAAFVEGLFEQYRDDPASVPPEWRRWFSRLPARDAWRPRPTEAPPPPAPIPVTPEEAPQAPPVATRPLGEEIAQAARQAAVLRLINAYRTRGHQAAELDPLQLRTRPPVEDLDPAFHNLDETDQERTFDTGSLFAPGRMRLCEIVELLRHVYCGPVGAEYMHITDTRHKRWIQDRLESPRPPPGRDERQRLLERIAAAEGLERYLHTRYVGQKRFSLEGGEVLIPLLDLLVQHAGAGTVREMVIGMAHRGRLNVLINILGKSPCDLFAEFEGAEFEGSTADQGVGDVKYHKGFSSNIGTPGGRLHLALAFNPSHLEIVAPVVEGSVRARQQRRGDRRGDQVLPVIIHGDSAFAGQGVVMETLQMSQARGYTTGGTVHIVVNNQIGFTTSNPLDTRSTLYCTDVAKMVQAPIFHVNGDDPEAVAFVTRLALDYRNEFHRDVVVDVICYRRHGHNEADEPAVTQPMMYSKIRNHPTLLQLYGERLVADGVLEAETAEALALAYRQRLDEGEIVARDLVGNGAGGDFPVDWNPYLATPWDAPLESAITLPHLQQVAERLLKMPAGFELHPRVAKILDDRRKMAAGALAVDWGFAELLAYGSLLMEGFEVRISGQDSGRGTFFHRHAVLHNQKDGNGYVPLQHLAPHQPNFVVIDSLLSEEAVLAFEYGYAASEPKALVIWEAQFGDFANGAQVVIDQFITSGEAKWGRLAGLTLFLPHGYEGQGAEHSSARLERYLQLCADDNIQVCVPTTPAQLFHLLRRQMVRPYRRPLVVLTPKSLLRNPLSLSSLEALYQGCFQCVADEADTLDRKAVTRVVLCTGKVYYDLLQRRRELAADHIALVRIEQIYPFPEKLLKGVLRRYPAAADVVWCQEEPKNQGAWYPSQHHIRSALRRGEQKLRYVGRPPSAAPAVGSHRLHVQQQQELVERALGPYRAPSAPRATPRPGSGPAGDG